MKKVILSLLLCSSFYIAQAQFNLGIKVGASTTNLATSDLNLLSQNGSETLRLALDDASYGIHAGVVLRAQFNKFIFQPEILFNSNSVDFRTTDLVNPSASELKTEKYQYLDVPVLFGGKFGPIRLLSGPVGHYFINSSSELTDFENYDQKFDEFTFGWIGGIGLDIWNLMIDFRYEGNFTKFGNHIVFAGEEYEFDDAPARFLFSLGILF